MTESQIQNQIIVEAGEKREMSNSPRGKHKSRIEKSIRKREAVQLGNGAISFPDKKSNGQIQ